MIVQDMWDLLTSKTQEGEIKSLDIPKTTTIQGWIARYAAKLCEKVLNSAQRRLLIAYACIFIC